MYIAESGSIPCRRSQFRYNPRDTPHDSALYTLRQRDQNSQRNHVMCEKAPFPLSSTVYIFPLSSLFLPLLSRVTTNINRFPSAHLFCPVQPPISVAFPPPPSVRGYELSRESSTLWIPEKVTVGAEVFLPSVFHPSRTQYSKYLA